VQDGNYEHVNPKTGKQVTIDELFTFASDYLQVHTSSGERKEPYYSQQVIRSFAPANKPKRASLDITFATIFRYTSRHAHTPPSPHPYPPPR